MRFFLLFVILLAKSQVLATENGYPIPNSDENGILYLDYSTFANTLKTHSLLIVFIYKINEPRSKHLEPIINSIASEIGVNKNLYPFAKVAAGLDKPEVAMELPNIVIYRYGKAVSTYTGLAEEYKVMDWLSSSLKKIDMPIPEEYLIKYKVMARDVHNTEAFSDMDL